MIAKCDCKSEYQDKKHGGQNRVHTEGKSGNVCCVCGKKKDKKGK